MKKADKLRLRHELVEARGGICENPDCHNPASDTHHCCIGDKKALKDILFTKYNLVLLCRKCNTSRIYDNESGRLYWWGVQCARYGEKRMVSWLDSVNEQVKIPYKF